MDIEESDVSADLKCKPIPIKDQEIYEYLLRTTYPDGFSKGDKRRLRSKASNFSIVDGTLFYQVKQCKMDSQKERHVNKRQVLLNVADQNKILNELHGSKECGGHLGVKKTVHKVEQRYFWSNMSIDVKNFVACCHTCQVCKIYIF